MKIAFITPTKDRPDDIRKMLTSYMAQRCRPDQVILVDSSADPVSAVVDEFPELKIDYKRWTDKPSAAGQRNGGIELLRDDIDLVCFFDDDQVLHSDAVSKMLAFWEAELNHGTDSADFLATRKRKDTQSGARSITNNQQPLTNIETKLLGMATFYNTDNDKDERPSGFKKSKLSEKLGLYVSRPGGVAPSGWQSLYGPIDQNTDVEWMGSGAAVIRRDVLMEFSFDGFFEGYSYLEDLDFSYSISRMYRMTVVLNARFEHHHHYGQLTPEWYLVFGRMEVRNRLYFVRKYGLSVSRCYLGLLIRMVKTLYEVITLRNMALLSRVRGNLTGLYETVYEKDSGA